MATLATVAPFLGSWIGREHVAVSGSARAAEAEGRFDITEIPGIGVQIDYVQRTSAAEYSGRGIMAADGWWWFDSMGVHPTEPGTARVVDGVLVLDRRTDAGRAVLRLSLQDGELVQMLDISARTNAPLQPAVRGAYVRSV